MACKELGTDIIKEFVDSFDYVMCDCDGVLWHGNNPIPGAVEALDKFRQMGKKVFFVTNNSSKTREEFLKKFHSLQFQASEDEIFSTAYAAAIYLKHLNFSQKVYVVGTKGITQELDRVNIKHTGAGPDLMQGNVIDWVLHDVEVDPEVGAVVVGFDEHISFPKMVKAATYLNNPKCLFLGTNSDERFPVGKNSVVMPGSGSILAAVKTAAEREPVMLGKPTKYLFETIVKKHGITPERTIMIGDRLNTDILLGYNCNVRTVLVLTGISTLEEVKQYEKSENPNDKHLIPNYFISSIGLFPKLIGS